MAARIFSFLFGLAFLVFVWMTYDNVYSDLEPIKTLAERAACGRGDCEKHHGLTQIERNSFGQTLTYRWDNAIVNVDCKREWVAAGERQCVAM